MATRWTRYARQGKVMYRGSLQMFGAKVQVENLLGDVLQRWRSR